MVECVHTKYKIHRDFEELGLLQKHSKSFCPRDVKNSKYEYFDKPRVQEVIRRTQIIMSYSSLYLDSIGYV